MHPVCVMVGIRWSVRAWAWVSGCDFETIEEETPPNVHVVKCLRCGRTRISWSFFALRKP